MSHVAASAPVTARLAPRAPLVARPRRRPGAPAPRRVSSNVEKSRAVRSRRSRPCVASASDDGPGAEIGLPGALAKAYDAVGDWLVAHPAPAWLVNSPLKTRLTEILAGPSYDPEASLARVKALIASRRSGPVGEPPGGVNRASGEGVRGARATLGDRGGERAREGVSGGARPASTRCAGEWVAVLRWRHLRRGAGRRCPPGPGR